MNKNKISPQRTKFPRKKLLLLIVGLLLISGLATWTYIAKFRNKIEAYALSTSTGCNYSDNRQIVCIGRTLGNGYYRYANSTPDGNGISPTWKNYWGNQNISSFLGHRADYWWRTERLNPNQNFLDCSGFVNIIFYLANGQNEVLNGMYSQSYQNDSRFKKISPSYPTTKDYSWLMQLRQGDLLIENQDITGKRHVAIFDWIVYDPSNNSYIVNTVESTATPNTTGKPIAGKRTRVYKNGIAPTNFTIHYGLRWNVGFPYLSKTISTTSLQYMTSTSSTTATMIGTPTAKLRPYGTLRLE